MRIWEKVTVKKIIHWPWQKEGTQEIFKDYVLCNFLKGFLILTLQKGSKKTYLWEIYQNLNKYLPAA